MAQFKQGVKRRSPEGVKNSPKAVLINPRRPLAHNPVKAGLVPAFLGFGLLDR